MEEVKEKTLEEKAIDLLKWKVTGKGKKPHFFKEAREIADSIDYLESEGYLVRGGALPNICPEYRVTQKGKDYVAELEKIKK